MTNYQHQPTVNWQLLSVVTNQYPTQLPDFDPQVPGLVLNSGRGGLWACPCPGQCHRPAILWQEVECFLQQKCWKQCCSQNQLHAHIIVSSNCISNKPVRRGIANGIFMSGGALGNMLMPVLLRFESFHFYFSDQFQTNFRHSINWFGFRGALLVHSACISTTFIAAATFRWITPGKWQKIVTSRPLAGADKSQDEIGKEGNEGGFIVCGKLWLPSFGQVFVWKVLANPLFLLLTFSVVTGRTAMRAFGMLVPAFGESLGLGKETSTYLLTIMAIADFISR